MEIFGIIVAGAAAWIFGAVWYGLIGKRWMAASGLTEETVNRSDPVPYIVSVVCTVLVAAMTAHIMRSGGVHGAWNGILTGLGLGAFIALPWQATNIMFAMRPRSLIWMDGAYTVVGCMLIGLILGVWG